MVSSFQERKRTTTSAAVFPPDSVGKPHVGTAESKQKPSAPAAQTKYRVKEVPILESSFVKQQEERGEISSAEGGSAASSRGISAYQARRSDGLAPRRVSAGTVRAQLAAEALEVPPGGVGVGGTLETREKDGKEAVRGTSNGSSGEKKEKVDPLDRQRVHCWVMVAAGHRELSESFFIEPSTGFKYALSGSHYQAIEVVWNNVNMWVNMQPNPKREGIAGVSWDLKKVENWERVLDDVTPERIPTASADGEEPVAASHGSFSGENSVPGTARRGTVETLLRKDTMGREKTPGSAAEGANRSATLTSEGARGAVGTPKGTDLGEEYPKDVEFCLLQCTRVLENKLAGSILFVGLLKERKSSLGDRV
jgi:hypothetical protein